MHPALSPPLSAVLPAVAGDAEVWLAAVGEVEMVPGQMLRAAVDGAGTYNGHDTEDWYPISKLPEAQAAETARARAVCADCPARLTCLELALRQRPSEDHGVWGGLLVQEQAELRRARHAARRASQAGWVA